MHYVLATGSKDIQPGARTYRMASEDLRQRASTGNKEQVAS